MTHPLNNEIAARTAGIGDSLAGHLHHELGRTRDWVVMYVDGSGGE